MSGDGSAEEATRVTVYEYVGGSPFFTALVDRFYDGVQGDDVLAPLYPSDDLDGARARLTGFLVQYWGGPNDYSQARGHPRLRMRHFPFAIGQVERDRWLHHMRHAVEEADTATEVKAILLEYFEQASTSMKNQD